MSNRSDDWFEEQIKPEHWQEEQRLRTPTLNVRLLADKTLYLAGAALREGFALETVQALALFLSERLELPDLVSRFNWTEEQVFPGNAFTARLQSDRTLYLTGVALTEGFSAEDALGLARFLLEHIELPPKEPPFDFEGFQPPCII